MDQYQVHRGTLKEMIKNEANKSVKLYAIAVAPVTTTPASIHQQSNKFKSDGEKRSIFTQKASQQKPSDDDGVKPMSKIDIIKKFDNKYKTEKNDEQLTKAQPPVARVAPGTVKHDKFLIKDDLENETHLDNRKLKSILDDVDTEEKSAQEANDNDNGNSDDEYNNDGIRQDSLEHRSSLGKNNFHKNGCGDNGSSLATVVGAIPPKPLPRTSRNNSISSDQGTVLVSTSDDSLGSEKVTRPVAKPRTSATSYKVHIKSTLNANKNANSLLFFVFIYRHIIWRSKKIDLWCFMFFSLCFVRGVSVPFRLFFFIIFIFQVKCCLMIL